MSKDMNVQIYKTWINGLDGTCYCSAFTSDETPGYPVNVDDAIYAKRLTDPELAAEYWMSSSRKERMLGYGDGYGSATHTQSQAEWDRMDTIRRFATLPHASETNYA